MANSDIIKIGFDYRASLAQFEKETNGVFDGISNKAGKQKITIQLDAKDDKVIDKIKELQKLKLDKFTFEFGDSGLKEQLQTFDKLENKINEIISLSKGIDLSFNTKNKTDAYNQLKKYADAFKDYYGNEEAMATNAGAKAGYAYYKAYEEALRKGVAQSKLEKVTIDFDVNDSIFSKERIVGNRIKEFENFQKYGNADESNLITEITLLENRLLKFNSAYSKVKANLGDAPITPEITKNIEEYVRLLEVAESRAKDAELFGYSSEDINSDKDLANMYLDFAKEDATAKNKKYIESLKQEETQTIATAEAEQKLAVAQKETVSNTSNSNNSQIEELKSDIQEVKTELGDVKDRISSIESNGFENVRDDVEKTKESVKELNSEFAEMKSNLSSTSQESNISSEKKDAFPSTEATASVEKTTQAIREENNVLDETVSKAKQAASELTKTRDIVSQNWYRKKGTVVGKDSKGNDITRDTDEFSFVERLKNGQLQTVLATYDEETGKWAEQVINVRTAFEQVEKAIISADNKIASLEMTKEKTLAAHPGYDTTADDNQIAIERKKRDELQNTLNLYGSEKEYVFEIEAATKRIADNQKRLNNKKQSQTNLRQAVSDEKDAKANEQANKRDAKQAQIEAENIKLAEQKSIYNELIDSIDRYSTVSKRIESDKAFEGDYEEAARLQEKIEELQNNPILSQEQLDASQRKLEKIETTLEDIATAKAKSDSIKVDSENVKNIQAEWDKNIKAIQDYMDAMTKLNNLKAKDKGTGSEANQIALQTQNVEELKQAAWDARKNLSSIQAENPDIIAWKQWVDMMKLFDQASKGSAESAAKLKDVLDNIKAPSLDKYENKLASYQTKKGAYNATIARFNDGGWTSDEYLKNVQAVKDAVNEYETLLNELKGKDASLVTSDDISKLDEYEKKIKDAIATVTNMSAAEKGYNFVSGQKELDKIHKLLAENGNMSTEAKVKIKAYYAEIESGNPSMSLDKIHGEILKIYNAEVEAGRAGRSFFDTLKNSGFHQLAAQMAGMFGVYDVINELKQVASTVRELDTAYTEMRKVSNESAQSLKNFQKESFSTADSVGTTALALQDATATWMRLGESLDEAKESAKDATVLLNVSEFENIDEATDSLVAMSQAYKELDKMEIIDVLDKIGNEYSISTNELSTALKDSAAVLKTQGNDLAESVALITAGNAITQDVSKTAGETLPERYRNIFYRTYLTARAA
jgi:hypothetical protein